MGPRVVRAKFRVISVQQRYDGLFVAELRPVQQRDKRKNEENKTFWEYTPSGEASLTYFFAHPLQVGAYYYVDMAKVDEPTTEMKPGLWKLGTVTNHDGGGGSVELSWHRNYDWQVGKPKGLIGGSLKMSLDAKALGALEAMQKAGSLWSVAFEMAEPTDELCDIRKDRSQCHLPVGHEGQHELKEFEY